MIDGKVRHTVFHKFSKLLGNDIAQKIELSIFNFSESYADNNDTPFLLESIYSSKVDELYCLISGENLKNVIKAIKNTTLDPTKIATMKIGDLNILLSNKTYIDIAKKKTHDMMLLERKGTSAFECKKCKKKNCSIIEKQVLSADEPATQFITCLECGHVFMI